MKTLISYRKYYAKRQTELTAIINMITVLLLYIILFRIDVISHLVFEQGIGNYQPIVPNIMFALFSIFLSILFFKSREYAKNEILSQSYKSYLKGFSKPSDGLGYVISLIKYAISINKKGNKLSYEIANDYKLNNSYARLQIFFSILPMAIWTSVVLCNDFSIAAQIYTFLIFLLTIVSCYLVKAENDRYLDKGLKPYLSKLFNSTLHILALVTLVSFIVYYFNFDVKNPFRQKVTRYIPLTIFILFAFTLRTIIYHSKRYFDNIFFEYIKHKTVSNFVLNSRDFLYLFILFILFLFLYIPSKDQWAHQIKPISVDSNNIKNISLKSRIKYIINNSSPDEYLYLICGQGGGSRAGATFYETMNNLDDKIGKNIVAISTISGSSNGAGFYLSNKLNGSSSFYKPTTDTLYKIDYLSGQAFRLLFTDRFINLFKILDSQDRNAALLLKEKNMYEKISNNNNSIFDLNVYEHPDSLPLFFPLTYNLAKAKIGYNSSFDLNNKYLDKIAYNINNELDKGKTITYGESISLSEMFPVISASATLKCPDTKLFNQFIDGGAYDNVAYEFTSELYKSITLIRDSLAPERKIIVLSIENGDYREIYKEKATDLMSPINAGLKTIFHTNNVAHSEKMNTKTEREGDFYYPLRVYDKNNTEDKTGFHLFKYCRNPSKSLVSRYLSDSEIASIKNFAKSNVDSFISKFNKNRYWTVYFDFNHADTNGREREIKKLENISDFINGKKVKICGFSDKYGEDKVRIDIATERRNNIIKYLKKSTSNKIEFDEECINPSSYQYHSVKERYLDRKVTIELK